MAEAVDPLPLPLPTPQTLGVSYLSSAILLRRGSSQPEWHSQWESMKTNTSPVALVAPSIRARMAPSLLLLLSSFTPSSLATYSLSADLSCPGIDKVVVNGVTGATGSHQRVIVSSSFLGAGVSARVLTIRSLLRCKLLP